MASVVPVNVRGPVMVALVSDPPAPARRPPRVVDPVPPKLTATDVVPLTAPVELVKRMELFVPESVRAEVDAEAAKNDVALSAVVEANCAMKLVVEAVVK